MRRASAALFVALVLTACPAGRDEAPPGLPREETPFFIAFFAGPDDPVAPGLLEGARLAAAEVSEEGVLTRPLEIAEKGRADGVSLAAQVADADVLGGVTVDGAAAIAAARPAIEEHAFPVFELTFDLYEAGVLRGPVFTMATPHSWQAWRLARYFGPGDRRYANVALARETTALGDVAANSLRDALAERSLSFVDVTAPVREAVERLSRERPEAVVVEGSPSFVEEVAGALSSAHGYLGRRRIHDGWRPQIAGFESMLAMGGEAWAPGVVAAGDYARPSLGGEVIPAVARFREAFRSEYRRDPSGEEVRGYDAVHLIAEAVRRAGTTDRQKATEALEGFDRVRFGNLPVSFGPDDHVAPERDVLGLWTLAPEPSRNSWSQLMRTFTSDLQRTNILEDDWPAYFEGTTPGGEAPFYYEAKSGVVTRPEDDLR